MSIEKLDAAIRAVCPIHGVNSERIISFKDEATPDQRAAAHVIVNGWDFLTPTYEQRLEQAKSVRAAMVASIIVTTQAGNTFDGDEISQDRMARAITSLNDGESTLWILSDDTPTMVSKEELREALRLAGAAQTAVWATPYETPV